MHGQHTEVGKEFGDLSYPNESKLRSLRRRAPVNPETRGTSYADVLGRDGPTVPGQLPR